MKKLARSIFNALFMTILLMESVSACRLWAVIAQNGATLSGSSDTRYLLSEELTAFYNEGAGQPDGWSLGFYRNNSIWEGQTVFRSPVSSIDDSTRFFSMVSTILDPSNASTIAIGHVRTASSGAVSIPDPHPFLFFYDGICYSFVLNGSFDREPFMKLLTNDGKDSSWLFQHPPHAYGYGDWRNEGFSYIVATELYLSWIIKNIAEAGDPLSGIAAAVVRVDSIIPDACSRNFIFSDGRRLFITGGSGCLYYTSTPYTVVTADGSYTANHRAVMTEPPVTGAASALNWRSILDNQMVVLTPDTVETYSYDMLGVLAKRNSILADDAFYYDNDADGYIDMVYISVEGAVTSGRIKEIGDSNLIELPDARQFNVGKLSDAGISGFTVSLNQDRTAVLPVTNTTSSDTLTMYDHHFTAGGRLFAERVTIHDRIAPVIISAQIRCGAADSVKADRDTLSIRFSEPVTFVTRGPTFQPFVFYRNLGSTVIEFSPDFTICSEATSADTPIFIIVNYNSPAIEHLLETDSIRIATSVDLTGDTVVPPNLQLNPGNVRRAVSIVHPERRQQVPPPCPTELFRFRAQASGRVRLLIVSLAGRIVYASTTSVQKNQWVSLWWTTTGSRRFSARETLLFSLSFGEIHKQGFLPVMQNRNVKLLVGD